jgi:hypothetical protein
VSAHVAAARAAEAKADAVTEFHEMSEAAYAAGEDPNVNAHLAKANGYIFVGDVRKANEELHGPRLGSKPPPSHDVSSSLA